MERSLHQIDRNPDLNRRDTPSISPDLDGIKKGDCYRLSPADYGLPASLRVRAVVGRG
jgi:hypothetical protein